MTFGCEILISYLEDLNLKMNKLEMPKDISKKRQTQVNSNGCGYCPPKIPKDIGFRNILVGLCRNIHLKYY